jgi:hypothetical protein
MVSKAKVLALLPAFRNEVRLVTWKQSSKRILNEIVKAHEAYEGDYDKIYSLFDTGDIYVTSAGLFNFCKYNMPYTVEGEDEQSVKSPSAILTSGQKTDCKHYSLFIGGVIGAIKYNEGDTWDWCYRFASYNSTKEIEHVFVVVKDGNREIWIDPVLTSFNQKKQPTYFIDKQPENMALYSISGIGDINDTGTITVDKDNAEVSFLVMLNMNCFGLKTLFKDNPLITQGSFRAWYNGQGFDYDHFLRILNA